MGGDKRANPGRKKEEHVFLRIAVDPKL